MDLFFADGEPLRNRTILAKKFETKLNFKKKVSLANHTEDFVIDLYENDHLLQKIALNVTGAIAPYEYLNSTPKVSFTFSADHSGVVQLSKTEAVYEEKYEEQEVDEVAMKLKKLAAQAAVKAANSTQNATQNANSTESNATTEASAEKVDDEKQEEIVDGETEDIDENSTEKAAEGEESAEETDGSKPAETAEKKTEKEGTEEIIYKTVQKKRKHTANVLFQIQQTAPLPMTSADIQAAAEELKRIEARDMQVKLIDEVKNTLESTIYSYRDKLETDEIIKVTTEEERAKISTLSAETEEWLFGDGTEADLATYNERLRSLQGLMEPGFERQRELLEREDLPEFVDSTLVSIGSMRDEVKNMTWVNETKIEAANSKLLEFETWWEDVSKKQQDLPAHEVPIYRVEEVKEKLGNVEKMWSKLKKTKKPKEPKKEKDKKKKKKRV